MEPYAIVPFSSRLNRQIGKLLTEQSRSHLNTKRNWYAIVPSPCEQPICRFQKLERRWNGTIAFPCELGPSLTKCALLLLGFNIEGREDI